MARFFNDAAEHKSHGHRIGHEEAHRAGVHIKDFEYDQQLQDDILTAYHLMTIMFEQSPVTKLVWANHGQYWIKNWGPTSV